MEVHKDLLLEAAGEGIYGLDENGLTTFANPAALKMLGYECDELLGKPMHAVLHHSHADGSHYPNKECPIYAAFKDGEVHHVDDEVFWRKDGSSFPVEYTSTPIREKDRLVGAVVVFKDITERLEAKARIEVLTRRNELILAAAGEGIYGVDTQGLTTFANPAALEMLGYRYEEVDRQSIHDMTHHTRADGSHFPKEECPIYTSFKDGKVHRGVDDLFWRKDGSSFPVEYTSTPIFYNGELTGAVAVFKDISERKKAEQELREAYREVAKMKAQLEAENDYLQEEFKLEHDFVGIIGKSHAIKQLQHQVELVAPTDASVLIIGESGTGKELVAHAIHERSNRKERPLIRVNCAAIPKELFESEFFGHSRGAFTGATKDRTGRFELAHGGTIFLDEVGEIPIELQSKLLRVLQEGQVERVGEEHTRSIDVRVIAATNRDLKKDILDNKFREDLFFRLNVFPIEAAPLRDRPEDIPLLAQHFIEACARRLNRAEPRLTQQNVRQLQSYHWPGNVRELQNVIERAIIVSSSKRLQLDLPSGESPASPHLPQPSEDSPLPYTESERVAADKANILLALKIANGKISGKGGAAELLQIKPTTLASRMRVMGIEYEK